jgi:hypothetical protein
MWEPVLEAARSCFPEGNAHAVCAFGIGPHIRRGRARPRTTLNVYVRTKLAKPKAAVPPLSIRVRGRVWTLRANVIATGTPARASAGGSATFTGLHAGAAISVQSAVGGRGAIACLLKRGDSPTHALTAGHLFAQGAKGTGVFAAKSPGATVVRVGTLVANFLDTDDVDAAVIELNAAGVAMVGDRGPALSDYLAENSVWGKQTRAFLATANDFSRETTTTTGPLDALLSAPTRGTFWVRGAIGTDGEVTNSGDSGTILCAGASNQFAVGTCSGALGAHSVFEPFERALTLVQNNVDSDLSV